MNFKTISSVKVTVSLFTIMFVIFGVTMYSVISQQYYLKRLDMMMMNWFAQQFGDPLRKYGNGFGNDYMNFCATFDDVKSIVIITILLSVIVLLLKKCHQAIWIILVITTGTWLNYLIKQTVQIPRPYSHLVIDSGWSFPSGHSNASTLFFLITILMIVPMLRRRTIQSIVVIIVSVFWMSVLFSRIYFPGPLFF